MSKNINTKNQMKRIEKLIKEGKICPICYSEEHFNGECESGSSYNTCFKEEMFK